MKRRIAINKDKYEDLTEESKRAIKQAIAEENGLTDSDSPAFTDNKKLMAYMKKRVKELQ